MMLNGHQGSNLPALTSAARVLHDEELPEVMFAIADPLHPEAPRPSPPTR